MIGFRFKGGLEQAKAGFFDRDAVIRAIERTEHEVMGAQGAMVRRAAQRSMAYGKKPSAPGKPPRAHTGGAGPLLRKFLFFSWDPGSRSTVVGPVLLSRRSQVPALHEFGGRANPRFGRRAAVYPPRPYMGPALDTTKDRLAEIWRGAMGRTGGMVAGPV